MHDSKPALNTWIILTSRLQIWLAMEEKDPRAQVTATTLIACFADHFFSIQYTIHPAGLPEEVQGKSSNISWAAQILARTYVDLNTDHDCIITVIDGEYYFHRKIFGN